MQKIDPIVHEDDSQDIDTRISAVQDFALNQIEIKDIRTSPKRPAIGQPLSKPYSAPSEVASGDASVKRSCQEVSIKSDKTEKDNFTRTLDQRQEEFVQMRKFSSIATANPLPLSSPRSKHPQLPKSSSHQATTGTFQSKQYTQDNYEQSFQPRQSVLPARVEATECHRLRPSQDLEAAEFEDDTDLIENDSSPFDSAARESLLGSKSKDFSENVDVINNTSSVCTPGEAQLEPDTGFAMADQENMFIDAFIKEDSGLPTVSHENVFFTPKQPTETNFPANSFERNMFKKPRPVINIPNIDNDIVTPQPIFESADHKEEAVEAPVPSHGIKAIKIRKKFNPNANKRNLVGTKFAPDSNSPEAPHENVFLPVAPVQVKNEFLQTPEKDTGNPFEASQTDSFLIPSTDEKKIEPEQMEEPVFLKQIQTQQSDLSMSSEANSFAVTMRKQQQNNKVLALKTKFNKHKIKVKLPTKIQTDEETPRTQKQQTIEFSQYCNTPQAASNSKDLTPYRNKHDIQKSHTLMVPDKEEDEFHSAKSHHSRHGSQQSLGDDEMTYLTSEPSVIFSTQNSFVQSIARDNESQAEIQELKKSSTVLFNKVQELTEENEILVKTKTVLEESVKKYKKIIETTLVTEAQSIDIGFMFASPIVNKDKHGNYKGTVPISYKEEVDLIKVEARMSKKQIVFKQDVAKLNTFDSMLALEPTILHISCHGFRQPEESLLFEMAAGEGIRVKRETLKDLIAQKAATLDLVYLAACTSEFLGQMFYEFGVQHVICIKAGSYVNDKAAVNFTRIFYKQIFQGKQICNAYNYAKASVECNHEVKDAQMFQLFKDDVHACYPSDFGKKGEFKCESDHSLIKEIQFNRKKSLCREVDLFELNKKILNMQTPVTFLFGDPGVGKSHLLRDACQFMQQRKEFAGGIVMMQFKQVKEVKVMQRQLKAVISRKCNISGNQQTAGTKRIVKHSASKQQSMQTLVDFFNLKFDVKKRKENTSFADLRKKNGKFLLCLDQTDSLLENNQVQFQDFLSKITSKCENLKIVVAAAVNMKELYQEKKRAQVDTHLIPKISIEHIDKQRLEPLTSLQSVVMFITKVNMNLDSKQLSKEEKAKFYMEYINFIISDFHYQNKSAKSDEQKQTKHDRQKEWEKKIKQMRDKDLIESISQHELFDKLLKGNSHEVIQLVDHVIFMCTEQAQPEKKMRCLYDYYFDLQAQNMVAQKSDVTASESMIGPLIFTNLEFFAALNMMPGGATLNQIRQLLPVEQSTNKEVLKEILGDHFFDEDEKTAEFADEELEGNGQDNNGKEKLYKLKPTYARLFEQRINDMLKDSKSADVAGLMTNRTQIMQVCDRLCNFFLQNTLQEKRTEQQREEEKQKRSRLSVPVDSKGGLDEEIAETVNLDNCFQVCIDNLDAADQEQETDIRVFDDPKGSTMGEQYPISQSARTSEMEVAGRISRNTQNAQHDSKSMVGMGGRGSVLCSQFGLGKLSLIENLKPSLINNVEQQKNLFARARSGSDVDIMLNIPEQQTTQDNLVQEETNFTLKDKPPLPNVKKLTTSQESQPLNQLKRKMTNTVPIEEEDEDEDDEPRFASIIGSAKVELNKQDTMVSQRELSKKRSSEERSSITVQTFAMAAKNPSNTLGVRSLFVINLIKNAFIEQQFDYCHSLSQKLLASIAKTTTDKKLNPNLYLLKGNAIRFLCLSKEQKYSYDKKQPTFDTLKIKSDLLGLYEKIMEADKCFQSGLSWKGTQINMAQGLCCFQQGMLLEKMSQFYTLGNFTQEEIEQHEKLTCEGFSLAQKYFSKAKYLKGVTLAIEHRAINDTLGNHSFAQYNNMRAKAAMKLHPLMKRFDSNMISPNGFEFSDNIDLLITGSNSARDRRNTNVRQNSGLEHAMVEDTDELQDPLYEIFDADTVLMLNIVK